MKLRRVYSGDRLELQSLQSDGSWASGADAGVFGGAVFDPAWELERARGHHDAAGHVLPFQPASFRDFMLYEQHAVDAARGLVRRFHPGQSRAAEGIERLTGKPFPLFKPKALFYRQPIYYMSNHLSFVPSGTTVAVPSYSTALDYELELGFGERGEVFVRLFSERVHYFVF